MTIMTHSGTAPAVTTIHTYRKATVFGRILCGVSRKKPGFPLQVLGSADALPVGFPLQSHCAPRAKFYRKSKPKKIHRN
jgi:hypothetical protein